MGCLGGVGFFGVLRLREARGGPPYAQNDGLWDLGL
jgi:hypothetical protein